MALLFVEAGTKKIHRHLEFVDQLGLGGVASFAEDDTKCFEVFFVEAIELGDEDVDGMRKSYGAVLQR